MVCVMLVLASESVTMMIAMAKPYRYMVRLLLVLTFEMQLNMMERSRLVQSAFSAVFASY